MEVRVFVTPHHYCCILFIELTHYIQLHTQGRRVHKGMNTRRQGLLGTILEAAYRTFSPRPLPAQIL